jgi:hypothetical protein
MTEERRRTKKTTNNRTSNNKRTEPRTDYRRTKITTNNRRTENKRTATMTNNRRTKVTTNNRRSDSRKMRREPITKEWRRRPEDSEKGTQKKVPLINVYFACTRLPPHTYLHCANISIGIWVATLYACIECQIKYMKALYLADRAGKSVVFAA